MPYNLLKFAISTDTEDSVPKSVDIQVYVVSRSTKSACVWATSYPILAILDYDIIEWEVFVFTVMCLAALTAESASILSTAVQEFLIGILLEGLTTIPFLYTYM